MGDIYRSIEHTCKASSVLKLEIANPSIISLRKSRFSPPLLAGRRLLAAAFLTDVDRGDGAGDPEGSSNPGRGKTTSTPSKEVDDEEEKLSL